MSRSVRLGIVGCGRLAKRGYLPAVAQLGSVALVGVADRDPTRCASVAGHVPAYASAAELLAAQPVDLLVLAHAADAHVADAVIAARHGAHALVEKPPARTAAEALPLADLQPTAWVGFNRRFEPGMLELREQVREMAGGRLALELSIRPSAWGAHDGSEPVLLDLGPHVVDLALWFAGRLPERFRVASLSGESAEFELDFGGLVARISLAHASGWRERIAVADEGGCVVARHERGGLARRLAARARPGGEEPLVASLAAQLDAVATAIRGGAPDPRLAMAADGIAVMGVLDEIARENGDRSTP